VLKCEHFRIKIPKLIPPKHLLRLWTYTWLCIVAACTHGQQQYHGILINGGWDGRDGYVGTQLYDPFNAPNAHGNLPLGLQTDGSATGGAAVANGPLAYFASGFAGTCVYDWHRK